MTPHERFLIIAGGLLLSFLVTGAVIALAWQMPGERTLIIGGLIGTGAFGGGALFGLLGAQRPSGTGPTTNVDTQSADVTVTGSTRPAP